jgi:hypothetical protein
MGKGPKMTIRRVKHLKTGSEIFMSTLYPKTFIIGAGASKSYKFPTGNELIELLKDSVNDRYGDQTRQFLKSKLAISNETLDYFLQKCNSSMFSIDRFISSHYESNDIIKLGKFLITKSLLKKQHEFSAIQDQIREGAWIEYLLSKLYVQANYEIEEFVKQQVFFVTFNYDMLLELYIWKFIYTNTKLTKEEAQEQSNKIFETRIIHIHGKISKSIYSEIGVHASNEVALANMHGIKILTENSSQDVLQSANNMISKSVEVNFLGFGYLFDNLDKLEIPKMRDHYNSRIIKGTCYDLKDAEIKDIKKYFNNKNGLTLQDSNSNWDCLEFLKNQVQFNQ